MYLENWVLSSLLEKRRAAFEKCVLAIEKNCKNGLTLREAGLRVQPNLSRYSGICH